LTIRTLRPALTALVTAAALLALAAPDAGAAQVPTVELFGTVVTVHADAPMVTLEPAPAPTNELLVNGTLVDVPGETLEQFDPGDKVEVTVATDPGVSTRELVQGLASGGEQAAADLGASTVSATQVAPAALPAPAGLHTVTVLPVYFGSKDSATVASLTKLGQGLKSFWGAQSGGAIDLSVGVLDWAKVADPGSCNYSAILNAALAANGKSAAVNGFQHYVVYFPQRSDCQWAGLATVGSSYVWINGYQNNDVINHEFGHNFGIGHAWTSTCTVNGVRVSWAASCTDSEYADTADVMGYAWWAATGNLNTALGDSLGLVTSQTASTGAPTTVDLAPLAQTSALRALKVPATNGTFFFDYRPAVAPDTRQPAWAGVQVHFRPTGGIPVSRLLDLRPRLSSPFSAASMPVNAIWQVPGGGVAVRVTGVDGSAAHLVATPVGSDAAGPVGATLTSPAAGASVGQGTTLTWQAGTDAGTGVGGYVVTVDGVTTSWLAAGTTALTLPTLALGSHTVRLDAVDKAGNVSTGTPVTFTVATGVENRATVTSPGADAWVGPSATVSWTLPAAAPIAVLVDGQVKATATAGSTSTQVTGLAEGNHSVAVVTQNSSGGTVATSAPVGFRVDAGVPVAPGAVTLTGSTLAWTAGSDTGSGVCGYEVSLDGTALRSTAAGSTSTSVTVPDGTHTFGVRTTDCAGNRSAATTLSTLKDSTRPTAPVITAPATAAVVGTTSARVTWSAATDAESGITGYRVTTGRGTATVAAGSTTATVDLVEGSTTIKVTAVNGGGLTADSAPVTVVRDTTAPTAPTKVTLSGDGHTLTWTAAKDKTALSYLVVVDGGTPAVVTGTSATVNVASGRHAFAVTAKDAAGNTSAAGTSGEVWFDSSAPSAPVVTSPSAGSYLRTRTATVTWTPGTDADSGVVSQVVYVNGRKAVTVDGAATGATVPLAEKVNSIVVRAVNGARLESSSDPVVVTVDSLAPKAPAKLLLSGSTLTWTAAADTGTPVTFLVAADGGTPHPVTEPTATLSLADGRHTLVVTAKDAAGNTSAPARLDPAWVDASAPSAPGVTSPTTGTTVGGQTVTVTWSAAQDADSGVAGYRVSVNGGEFGKLQTGTSARVRVTANGTLTVRVVAVNLAGVVSAEATVDITVTGSRLT
jgi:hypothetical protein